MFGVGDACVHPVLEPDEVATAAHSLARNAFVEVDGIPQPAPAPRFDRTPSSEPLPRRGASVQLLRRWGLTEQDLARVSGAAEQEATSA